MIGCYCIYLVASIVLTRSQPHQRIWRDRLVWGLSREEGAPTLPLGGFPIGPSVQATYLKVLRDKGPAQGAETDRENGSTSNERQFRIRVTRHGQARFEEFRVYRGQLVGYLREK